MEFVTLNQNFSILFWVSGGFAPDHTPPCMDPTGDGTLFCPPQKQIPDYAPG